MANSNWKGPQGQIELSPFLQREQHSDKMTLNEKIIRLKEKSWTKGEFKKENWGNSLHSVAPYIGRIKPAFAHWLIRIFTDPGDIVLDPFCGIGTVPLESDLMGRIPIGIDLNPYGVAISKAKFDRRTLEDNLTWLESIDIESEKRNVSLDEVPDFVRKYYHKQTLIEILTLKHEIIKSKRDFLLGCLLGIIHGHRSQYLSAWTGYIIPFEPKTQGEYRPVIPRMIAKVTRMYRDGFPLTTQGVIYHSDARKMPIKNNSVDVVITSPPYFDTIDYAGSNRVRLAFLGHSREDISRLKGQLIQQQVSYLEAMEKVGRELLRVMKNGSLCLYVLGDCHKGNKTRNTAEEVGILYQRLGFEVLGSIEDEIPLARRTALKWEGAEGIQKHRKKFDRILILRKPNSHGEVC